MTEDVVWRNRLFKPPDVERRERLDPLNRLYDIEALIRVDHEHAIRANFLANDARATHIVFDRLTNLHLEMRETIANTFAAARAHGVVRVADPSATRCVRGETFALDARDPLGARRVIRLQHRKARGFIHSIANAVKVDRGDEFFGGHVGEQAPEWLTCCACFEIPHGIDDRGNRERHHALFRAEPEELRVLRERAPKRASIGANLGERLSNHKRHHRTNRLADDLVAAADRERESVTFTRDRVGRIGAKDDVRRGVVRIDVHGV